MSSKAPIVLNLPELRLNNSNRLRGDERKLKMMAADASQQKAVTDLFESTAQRWRTLYTSGDIFGRIFQHRLSAVLSLVDQLALEANSEVLDVGCGAGLASVALAKRGHFVESLDVSPAMLKSTREHAIQAGVSQRVKARLGNVYDLAFPNETFHLVLAIGITAWLDSLEVPLDEIARVLKPGGHLIVSAANSRGLHLLLDPRLNPGLAPARKFLRRLLRLRRRRDATNEPNFSFYSSQEFDALLARAGFRKLESLMFGFGPFSMFGRQLIPNLTGVCVDRWLQRLADKVPSLKSTGRVYLVLARKEPHRPS